MLAVQRYLVIRKSRICILSQTLANLIKLKIIIRVVGANRDIILEIAEVYHYQHKLLLWPAP